MRKSFKFRFIAIAALLATIAAFSVAVTLLWNAVMPDIFGLNVLNYWQAAGLLLLARILFGGLGLGHFWPHGKHGGANCKTSEFARNAGDRPSFFSDCHAGLQRFQRFWNYLKKNHSRGLQSIRVRYTSNSNLPTPRSLV